MFNRMFGFIITFVKNQNQAAGNEIFYIGGNEILPPPLQANEEAALLKSWIGYVGKRTLIERN